MNILQLALFFLSLPSCAMTPRSDESLEQVYARVHNSVVTIKTLGRTGLVDARGRVATESGIGSGVVISDDGKIMTAAHVVHSADQIVVEFSGGYVQPALVIGSDPFADVAMIQLDGKLPSEVTVATLGDSSTVATGAQCFVVGAPLGITHTLTVGHISARRTSDSPFGGNQTVEFFQTDAPINKGNSGGPMFNMRGEVIGIVSYIISKSGGSDGLGFAVTSNLCRERMLERHSSWSGLEFVMLAGDFAAMLNLPDGNSGLLVQRVAKGSPAEIIGLHGGSVPARIADNDLLLGGDVILEAQGISVNHPEFFKLLRELDTDDPESTFSLVILREGKRMELSEKIGVLEARLQKLRK